MEKQSELHPFFLIVSPGLEKLAYKELIEKCSLFFNLTPSEIDVKKGGIEFKSPLAKGCNLNHLLKIPTRILYRIDSSIVRDLPKLFSKLSKIKWSNYLTTKHIEIKSSSFQSRLFDSRKIESTALDAIKEYFKHSPLKKKYAEGDKTQSIYIKFENDLMTISLDLSGDRLDQRGVKLFSAIAPIRESLAAACFYQLIGDKKNVSLIDPMVGTGTFLLEAYNFYHPNYKRTFSYEHFSLFLQEVKEKKLQPPPRKIKKLYGFDINEKTLDATEKNFVSVKNKTLVSLKRADIFKDHYDVAKGSFVIINPPYNKRIRTSSPPHLYYLDLIQNIQTKLDPKGMGMVIPQAHYLKIKKQMEVTSETIFKNGGIEVVFVTL